MISVEYNGGLGNRLFQYCFGRVLSNKMGYSLRADSISHFPGTNESVNGVNIEDNMEVLDGHVIDINSIILNRDDRKIVTKGFFQRYEYYKDYKDEIRNKWLHMENVNTKRSSDDLVIHVRLGDFKNLGHVLSFDHYSRMINLFGSKNVYIVTDNPGDVFINQFNMYNPIIINEGQILDFKFIMSFDNIVLSQSTFSWWASFLSDASKIAFPIPSYGYWSEERQDIDLRVSDESRYVFVE